MQVNGVILVLGSPNDAQGHLSSIALERCSQALAEFRKNPGYAVLPTGGWGEHFNTTDKPHGFYVRRELQTRGFPNQPFCPALRALAPSRTRAYHAQSWTRTPTLISLS